MAPTEVMPAATKPRVGRTADPCVMVIFGYSGDLTRRKLIPALYNLASQQLLSREFAVIGVGLSPMSDEDARKKLTEDFKQFATGAVDPDLWEWFVRRVSYVSGDFDDPATYDRLKETVARVDQEHNSHANCFFLPGHRAQLFWRHRRAALESRPDDRRERPLAAGDYRKTFRSRSGVRQGFEPATVESRFGKPDLPHRSLSDRKSTRL